MSFTLPRLSVCMATFNGERFIEEQIATILSQLSANDELVVSDDSSKDRTVDLVRALQDPRIRILEGNRFASPIFNFQNALRHAKHDVLVLADQDDSWLPNKAQIIRERFANPPCAHYAIVLDGVITDSDGLQTHPSIFEKIGSQPGIAKNIFDNTFLGCCMAFSRASLNLALPFPDRTPMHDMWIGLVTSAFGRVDFLPEKTIRYRKHRNSVTDFKREFRPILQMRRRAYLTYSLLTRCWERRRDRQVQNAD